MIYSRILVRPVAGAFMGFAERVERGFSARRF
jgi:hypothetical protein